MRINPLTHLTLLVSILLLGTSFAQLTFPSSYIQLADSDMTLYFEFDDTTQTLTMGLDMSKDVDYFAIGFANEGNVAMTSFDIVSFIFIPNSSPAGTYTTLIQDMFSIETIRPPADTQQGGTADYILLDSYVTDGSRQVLFKRAYDTHDVFDYMFDPVKVSNSIIINWAFGDRGRRPELYDHDDNAGTAKSQMYNGFQGTADDYEVDGMDPGSVYTAHGYIMLFGWGILVEVMLQIGRYMKFIKFFAIIHLVLAMILYAATVITTALALYIGWGGAFAGPITLAHLYMGVIILALCSIQIINGIVLRFKIVSKKATRLIPLINKSHMAFAIIIYILTKAEIGLGLYLFNPDLMVYLYVYYGIILVFRVGQESSHTFWTKLRLSFKRSNTSSESNKPGHRELMNLLNNKTPVSEILEKPELKRLRWAILDNKVFDLKGFTHHPGGNFILNEIQGREIGRFMYGSYGLELFSQNTQHSHSKQAMMIVQRNLIGTINHTQEFMLPLRRRTIDKIENENREESLISPVSNKYVQTQRPNQSGPSKRKIFVPSWSLKEKIQITPLITQFVLSSESYLINPSVTDIRDIGKHMKISHVSQKKIRLYTVVLSLTENRKRKRNTLWNKFQNKEAPLTIINDELQYENLSLVVKRYDPVGNNSGANGGTFSQFLHRCPIQTEGFNIEGPFGTGLGLTQDSTGLHYIFAAGTGILPFLDLFDYLLQSVLENNDETNILKKGFKLQVFAGFNDIKDFVGIDICTKLVEACRGSGLEDAFTLTIRAKDVASDNLYTVSKEKFDGAFVDKYVNKECEKAFICGPPIFNQHIPAALSLLGVSKTKIILV